MHSHARVHSLSGLGSSDERPLWHGGRHGEPAVKRSVQ
jgi:hypothetical protein